LPIDRATLHRFEGQPGLVAMTDHRLFLFRDGIAKPTWTWPVPGWGRMLAIHSDKSVVTIIVQSGTSVFGIDGDTGKPRWRCDGPGPVRGLLSEGDGEHPAAVAFTVNSTTVVREALPTGDAGRCTVPDMGPVAGLKPIESAWLTRPLPWVRSSRLWWDLFAVLFLLGLALVWWLRWRKTSVGIGLVGLLIGAGVSAYMLRSDAALKHPEQHYAWTDWYGVLSIVAALFGGIVAFYAGFFTVVAGPIYAFRRFWSRRKKAQPA
jgi:hypothetical protein